MSEQKTSDHRFYEVEGDLYYLNKDDEIYKLDLTKEDCGCQSDTQIDDKDIEPEIPKEDVTDKDNINEQDNSEATTLPSETVKHPGSFRAWCKSKGLMGKDGKVGDKCVEAGLNSNDKRIQAKAKLAKAFKTMRGKKDFTDDMIDEMEGIIYDSELNINEINAINNKIKGESETDFEMTQTSETKPDGSTAMMERRISQCMEQTGKSREQCSKEVKAKMKKMGSENTNTSDLKEEVKKDAKEPEKEKDEEEEEEEKPEMKKEEKKEEKKDTVEVCAKEYDFLKKKQEELKTLQAEKEKAEKELDSFKKDFLSFKAKIDKKEADEKEAKRQELIKRISNDFQVPEELMKNDSMEQLEHVDKLLEAAIKRDTEELEEPKKEDFHTQADEIHKRYFVEA